MKNVVASLILWASLLALASTAFAQQESHPSVNNPLAVLLESKGILTPAEVASINQAASPEDANARLAKLLVKKVSLAKQEFASTHRPLLPPPQSRPSQRSPNLRRSVVCLTRCFHPQNPSQNPTQSGQTPTRNSAYARARFRCNSGSGSLRVLPLICLSRGA